MNNRHAISVMLMMALNSAYAEEVRVYKDTTQDGGVTFSDHPLTVNSETLHVHLRQLAQDQLVHHTELQQEIERMHAHSEAYMAKHHQLQKAYHQAGMLVSERRHFLQQLLLDAQQEGNKISPEKQRAINQARQKLEQAKEQYYRDRENLQTYVNN